MPGRTINDGVAVVDERLEEARSAFRDDEDDGRARCRQCRHKVVLALRQSQICGLTRQAHVAGRVRWSR